MFRPLFLGPSSGHKHKLRKLHNVSYKISYIDLKFNEISSFFLLIVIIASFKIVKSQTVYTQL